MMVKEKVKGLSKRKREEDAQNGEWRKWGLLKEEKGEDMFKEAGISG